MWGVSDYADTSTTRRLICVDPGFVSRTRHVHASPTVKLTQRFQQTPGVIAFAAGEPDFATPEHIKDAAREAINDGFTRYTASTGVRELKEAVADRWKLDLPGVAYEADRVIVSCGAKHALYNTFQVLLEPGDAVLIPAPYWVSYPEQVRLAGGVPVFLPTDEASQFQLHPEQVAEACVRVPQARALVLNSPSNPTGTVYPLERLEALAAAALRHDLFLISDEIYRQLVYGGIPHRSVAALPGLGERTFLVDGVSKAYAMTGWRIGFVGAPPAYVRALGLLQDHSTSNPTSIAQRAAWAALTGDQGCVVAMRAAFERRRDRLLELLGGLPGVSCAPPQGAFYAFPNLGKVCRQGGWPSTTPWAEELLSEAGVGVIPGEGFGAPGHVRLSYAVSEADIEEGMTRLRRFLVKQLEQ